jgi:hypothetical protein
MPEPDDWHRFVFTNHDVTILFVAYLRRDFVGEDDKRIKFLFVSPDDIELFAPDACPNGLTDARVFRRPISIL